MLVPIGLNMCPPFHSISPSLRGAAILVPARTVIEDETRRNVFWLAYATDRTSSLSHGWAHALGDEDIAQLLPVRGDQFDRGVGHIVGVPNYALVYSVFLIDPSIPSRTTMVTEQKRLS